MGRPLPRRFFARDADVVARDLLGRVLVHDTEDGRLACRIVETEAYFGPPGRNAHLATRDDLPRALRRVAREGDPASHSYVGMTDRNRVMYGPPGYAYVYRIYGLHDCMNVTTGPLDPPEPQAVLLRAGEPIDGADAMARRRGRSTDLASGPARLAQAMGITRALYGADLTRGPLRFEDAPRFEEFDVTPRIGITVAADLPLRFVARGSPHASKARFTASRRKGAASAAGTDAPPPARRRARAPSPRTPGARRPSRSDEGRA